MSPIAIVFLIIFVNMLGFGIIIPLAPTFQATFHLTSFEYGILGAIFPLSQMISAPFLGRLSDKKGRKPVILYSFFILSLSYVVLAFSHSFTVLIISRLIGGFFAGSFVVAMACAVDISTKETRRKYMGLAGMAFGFGFMLGPTLGGLFAGKDPLHANVFMTAMIAFSLSMMGVLLVLRFLPETLKEKIVPTTSITKEILGIFKRLKDFLNFSLSTVLSMVLAGLEVFLSLWIAREFNFNPFNIGVFWTFFALVMNIGRVGLLRFLKGQYGVVIGFCIIFIANVGFYFTTHLSFVYFWTIIFALVGGVLITLINTNISLNTDPKQQGLFMGINNAAGNVGRMLSPAIMGFFIHHFGDDIHVGWFVLCIVSFLAIVAAFLLITIDLKEKKEIVS